MAKTTMTRKQELVSFGRVTRNSEKGRLWSCDVVCHYRY